MTWLEHINKDLLKHDIIKVITWTVIAHILTIKVSNNTENKTMFDEVFIKKLLYVLIGFVVFYFVIEPFLIGSIKK